MRIPPQPNTSININFPMYLPPYHAPYQYQSNPQRYPGQQPSTSLPAQYNTPGQPPMKPPSSQYGNYNSNGLANLPPYAEYQEYKKRENDRRRWKKIKKPFKRILFSINDYYLYQNLKLLKEPYNYEPNKK